MVEISSILQQVKKLEELDKSVSELRNGLSKDKNKYTQETINFIYSMHKIGTEVKDIATVCNIKPNIVESILKDERNKITKDLTTTLKKSKKKIEDNK